MRIAIISDIHANPAALTTVLDDAERQGCSRIVCLGDLVGYGYDPAVCIDICRERGIECLLGNHDAGLISRLDLNWFNSFAADAVRRQRPLVSEDSKKWLAHLPYNSSEESSGCCPYAFAHGFFVGRTGGIVISPMADHFDYIHSPAAADAQFMVMALSQISVLFVGHTHFANIYAMTHTGKIQTFSLDTEDERPLDLAKFSLAVVNVGSVGYPRNQPYSIYGIYDTDTNVFKHRILPFDFGGYAAKMEAAGAPVPIWFSSAKKQAEDRPIGFR